jgi:hypothetical protein
MSAVVPYSSRDALRSASPPPHVGILRSSALSISSALTALLHARASAHSAPLFPLPPPSLLQGPAIRAKCSPRFSRCLFRDQAHGVRNARLPGERQPQLLVRPC